MHPQLTVLKLLVILLTALKLPDILNMTLSVYDAVIGSYENSGGSFADGQLLSIREKKMVMKANSKSMLHFWLILRHQMLEMGI